MIRYPEPITLHRSGVQSFSNMRAVAAPAEDFPVCARVQGAPEDSFAPAPEGGTLADYVLALFDPCSFPDGLDSISAGDPKTGRQPDRFTRDQTGETFVVFQVRSSFQILKHFRVIARRVDESEIEARP